MRVKAWVRFTKREGRFGFYLCLGLESRDCERRQLRVRRPTYESLLMELLPGYVKLACCLGDPG